MPWHTCLRGPDPLTPSLLTKAFKDIPPPSSAYYSDIPSLSPKLLKETGERPLLSYSTVNTSHFAQRAVNTG